MWGARQIATWIALLGALALVWVTASKLADPVAELPSDRSPVTSPEQPVGPAARSAAGGEGELPGTLATRVPASIDFSRPTEVARAYLAAAYTVRAADRGRTNRRVLAYLAPTNPDYPRGIVVPDAPGPGQITKPVVNRVDVVRRNEDGSVIVYRAHWTVSMEAERAQQRSAYLVLARQVDGRWLIAQDTPRLQPGD